MIELSLHEVGSYRCPSRANSLPVIAELLSKETLELATKIDLRELTLTPIDAGPDDWFGQMSRSPLGIPGPTWELTANKPHFLVFDLFRLDDDDSPTPPPGSYHLAMRLDLYRKCASSFEKFSVAAKREIVLTENWSQKQR